MGWLCVVFVALAFSQRGTHQARVKPPSWAPNDAADVFFNNVFEEALIGTRPQSWRLKTRAESSQMPSSKQGADVPAEVFSKSEWTSVIAAPTIESEIKRLKQQIDKVVTSPARFASGDHLKARRYFSLLAVMFSIVADYGNQPVRWKKDAVTARNEFARVAAVAKVHSEQAFKMARARQHDLSDLIAGNPMPSSGAPVPMDWSNIGIRAALMKRMDVAFEAEMLPAIADEKIFKRSSSEILHQAEIVAAIATVLTQEGMEDGSEFDYEDYCQQIKEAVKQVQSALETNDYKSACSAVNMIRNACDQCHEKFRL